MDSPVLTTTTSSESDGSSERASPTNPASAAKAPFSCTCRAEISILPPPEAMTQRSGRCSIGRWLAATWMTPLKSPSRRRPSALTVPSRSAGTAAAARRSSGRTRGGPLKASSSSTSTSSCRCASRRPFSSRTPCSTQATRRSDPVSRPNADGLAGVPSIRTVPASLPPSRTLARTLSDSSALTQSMVAMSNAPLISQGRACASRQPASGEFSSQASMCAPRPPPRLASTRVLASRRLAVMRTESQASSRPSAESGPRPAYRSPRLRSISR
jgi:hypothetical protein